MDLICDEPQYYFINYGAYVYNMHIYIFIVTPKKKKTQVSNIFERVYIFFSAVAMYGMVWYGNGYGYGHGYDMLQYVMLCYVILCYVMLCYVMLCYVMLCYVMYIYMIRSESQNWGQ